MKRVDNPYVDFLSDIEDGPNGEIHVEWDGAFGKHWQTFYNKEDFQAAMKANEEGWKEWEEMMKKEAIEKGRRIAAKRKSLKEAKTLGGQFPVLKEMLIKLRS